MKRSGIATRGLGGPLETARPLAAVGNGAKPDRLGAVLALVVGDLARPWTKRRRQNGHLTAPTTAGQAQAGHRFARQPLTN